jgi:hypothetical protein
MTIGIMQPYFLPYIGYWQLVNAVDRFVVYDNIKYTKKGWINRNRFLMNGRAEYLTIPLERASDFLDIRERWIKRSNWGVKKWDDLRSLQMLYHRAPYFKETFPVLENIITHPNHNLFAFIYNSICEIKQYLDIKTPLIISSTVAVDHTLRAQDKVIAICEGLEATKYINAIGGIELYNKEEFKKRNIELNFIKADPIEYKQQHDAFVPWLSILDVMMFNSKEDIKEMLNQYTLI